MTAVYVGYKTKIVNDFSKKRPYGYCNVYADNGQESTVVRFFSTELARDKAAKYDRDNYGYREVK